MKPDETQSKLKQAKFNSVEQMRQNEGDVCNDNTAVLYCDDGICLHSTIIAVNNT